MLQSLLNAFKSAPNDAQKADGHALPEALSALLIEGARADEQYTDAEQSIIKRMLMARFSVDEAEAGQILERAETAQAEANDIYGFTRIINDQCTAEEKLSLVEDLWAVVLTDHERDPYEEMLIRRIVGLIHLEDRDSTIARRRAEEKASGSGAS